MKKREWLFLPAFMLFSCAEPNRTSVPNASATTPAPLLSAEAAASDAHDAPAEDAGAGAGEALVAAARTSLIARDEAIDMLFTSMRDHVTPPECAGGDDDAIRCLLDARYASDSKTAELTRGIFDRTGSVLGVEREHMMDGGYRGTIHIAPVLPGSESMFQVKGVALALLDFDEFFAKLQADPNAHVTYRWRSLAIRFFRSVHARTPSAYASGWRVAFNVDGSLNHTDVSIRETMFHEVFHLNDSAHGTAGDDWSEAALARTYAAIIAKCKATTRCLSKYAPNDTMVKGGTYYAFQPGNDVREYAAELAVRYYKEQRSALGFADANAVKIPFKCTGKENAASWKSLVDEFFGGVDRTRACP